MTGDLPESVRRARSSIGDISAGAFLTDFDGTLAPIVPDPAHALPIDGAAAILRELSTRMRLVGVVSGRPVSFLLAALGYPEGKGSHPLLLGVYGLESWSVSGGVVSDPAALAYRDQLDRAGARARASLAGVDVEDKGLGVTLHWRRDPGREGDIRATAEHLSTELGLPMVEGKMCVELVPPLARDKGTAVSAVLGSADTVTSAVFIGDDLGDCAAFTALAEWAAAGNTRCTRIAVADRESPAALLQGADVVLASPAEVLLLMEALVE